MSVEIGGEARRIGLALSGGGFRAAAFHLGAMRKLHELKLLSRVDLVSCVSGGSIAGATMAMHWDDPSRGLAKLEEYLTTQSEAVSSVLLGILDPFRSRLDLLAEGYAEHIFGQLTLGDLQKGPRLYLNATNLATGKNFFFVTGSGGDWNDVVMGDWALEISDARSFSVAKAVAASSSFPPVFPPLELEPDVYPPGAAVGYVTLTDGGVYDNMGIGPTLRPKNRLDYLIVSDGGSPLDWKVRPTEDSVLVLYSAIMITMQQIRALELARLESIKEAGKRPTPLWFSIDSEVGARIEGDGIRAGNVGTNLMKLDAPTMDLLTRHGGALVERRLHDYAPELVA